MKIHFIKTVTVSSLSLLVITLAHAQHTYVLAVDNPFSPVTPSHFASPALADIDADGDQDLFVGQYNSNTMLFYRNTGTAQDPQFEAQTGTDNPLDIYTSNSGCNAPTLVDIDADGDLDVFVGIWSYIIRHLKNEGSSATPDFVFQTGADNPLDHVMTDGICSFPAFVDIDGDMDLDVFVTDGNGNISFYENTGDQTAPVFEFDAINNALDHVSLTHRTKIVFHDVSGDGLKDAVISHDTDEPELLYFENIGTPQNAVFEQRTDAQNPFDGITGTEALVPAFADIDDDGDKDLILGTWQSVRLYEAVNTSPARHTDMQVAFSIYPNPAGNQFTVNGGSIREIEIIDPQGTLVKRTVLTGNPELIGLDEVIGGIYFVRLITETGNTIKKVVLQGSN